MWFLYAILSCIFASLTAILSKMGLEGVPSNLATALRTVVVLGMSWVMVFITKTQVSISSLSEKNVLFILLSGVATGASWLFYFKALQLGEASKVVPIDKLSTVLTILLAFLILGEPMSLKSVLGCILIGCGTLVMVL